MKFEITSKCFSSGWWPCWHLVGYWEICFLGTSAEAPTINSPIHTITLLDITLEITTILNRVLTTNMEKNLAIKITV